VSSIERNSHEDALVLSERFGRFVEVVRCPDRRDVREVEVRLMRYVSSAGRFAVPLAVVAGVCLAVGVATGAIPDGAGEIHGCYDAKDGQLRVIDTEAEPTPSCAKGEEPIAWNQQGPQGEPGPPGPGSRIAQAYVRGDGQIFASGSEGVSEDVRIPRGEAGQYCLDVTDFNPRFAQVTPVEGLSEGARLASVSPNHGYCQAFAGPGYETLVQIYDESGQPVAGSFNVTIYPRADGQ
jgi:hypothetical protein